MLGKLFKRIKKGSDLVFSLRSEGYDARNRKVELWESEFGYCVKVPALGYDVPFMNVKDAVANFGQMVLNTQP